jgi:hypothetical protein
VTANFFNLPWPARPERVEPTPEVPGDAHDQADGASSAPARAVAVSDDTVRRVVTDPAISSCSRPHTPVLDQIRNLR